MIKKWSRQKIIAICILIFTDIWGGGYLVQLPAFVASSGMQGLSKWVDGFSIFAFFNVLADKKAVMLWLIMQGLFFALLLHLLYRPKLSAGKATYDAPPAAGNGQFGTSRWMTEKEIEEEFQCYRFGESPKSSGIVFGFDGKKIYDDPSDTQTLIVGMTRSGKTRRLVIPSIYALSKCQNPESMIINDPKGELYEYTAGYLKSIGYDVHLIDFRDRRGDSWNPILPVVNAVTEGDIAKASEYAWDIANLFAKSEDYKGDPLWPNGEESTIAALILAVAMHAPQELKHMTSVYQMLCILGEPDDEGFAPINEYFKNLPMGHLARSAFTTASLSPFRTRASFFTGVSALLRLWSDPSICDLTSTQSFNITDVGNKPTAVFVVVPDEKKTKHILASLFYKQSYQLLSAHAIKHGGRLPVRINYLLDEFGNLPPISDFETIISVSLSRGIRWSMFVQGLDQFKNVYPKAYKTIKNNGGTLVYLLCRDMETAEELSKLTGKYTVSTDSFSSSVQDKGSSSSSSSVNLTGRSLMLPDEILRIPKDQALVFRSRCYPARTKLIDLSCWPMSIEKTEQSMNPLIKVGVPKFWIPEGFYHQDCFDSSGGLEKEKDEQEYDVLEQC